MNVAAKLTIFAAMLFLAFVVSIAAGRAVDPEKPSGRGEPEHANSGEESQSMSSGGHGAPVTHAVRGLSVEYDGLRLDVRNPELRRGVTQRLSFRIIDSNGEAIRSFAPTHTKPMHLIIVRRDLTGFQHLHPKMSQDGTWNISLALPEAGSYRVFADFTQGGEPVTLASDLRVDGGSDLKPLPAEASSAISDGGYHVRIDDAEAHPGKAASLRFAVSREGDPVEVEEYLGAAGHLVALREGDLAFLHVHPEEHRDTPGGITFESTFPTAGSYRLFLQFKHNGRIQTVAFTKEVK